MLGVVLGVVDRSVLGVVLGVVKPGALGVWSFVVYDRAVGLVVLTVVLGDLCWEASTVLCWASWVLSY